MLNLAAFVIVAVGFVVAIIAGVFALVFVIVIVVGRGEIDVEAQLARVEGVGHVRLFGGGYAMRIWLDPNKLRAYALTPGDVVAAVRAQNAQFSVGQLGDMPQVANQQINATVTARGRLHTAAEFGDIIVRGSVSGAALRLRDLARVEIGASTYAFSVIYNRKPATG